MMPLNQASATSGIVSVEAARNLVAKHLAAGNLPDDPVYRDPTLFDFLLQSPATSIPEAALRYVLHHEVSTVCVGMRSPDRLRENLRATTGGPPYLPAEQVARLRELFGGIRRQER
jgi:aryl-alcohol dehydrogenase-like predicted oxidoreductase